MRTTDFSTAGGTILEFLVHQQLSPGVNEPRRASLAQAAAALSGLLQTVAGLDAAILDYLDDNGLWLPVVSPSNTMVSGDLTNGVAFRSDLITGPISRQVWTPRSDSVPAIDITPKGASPVPISGRLGWHEFCSTDFLGAASGDPFHTMRLAVRDDGGSIGTFDFNGQTAARPVSFYVNGAALGQIDELGVLQTTGGGKSGTYVIADDAVLALPVPRTSDPKWAILAIQRNAPGMAGFLRIKAGTGAVAPVEISMIAGSVTLAYTTGVLSGTTGSDGNITISAHTNGNVYIENRAGAGIIIGLYWIAQ